jgi:hypothetical protein
VEGIPFSADKPEIQPDQYRNDKGFNEDPAINSPDGFEAYKQDSDGKIKQAVNSEIHYNNILEDSNLRKINPIGIPANLITIIEF